MLKCSEDGFFGNKVWISSSCFVQGICNILMLCPNNKHFSVPLTGWIVFIFDLQK